MPPHGHCHRHELEHTEAIARNREALRSLAETARRCAPEFYAQLSDEHRARALEHIAAHVQLGGGQMSPEAVRDGLEDYLQEARERGSGIQ